jgi:hypothetical protein
MFKINFFNGNFGYIEIYPLQMSNGYKKILQCIHLLIF